MPRAHFWLRNHRIIGWFRTVLGIALMFSTVCLNLAKKFLSFPPFFFSLFYCKVVPRVTEASSSPRLLQKCPLILLFWGFSPGVWLCQGLVCLLQSQISGQISLELMDSSCIFLHKIPDILGSNVSSPVLLTQWKSDGFTLCSLKTCLGVALGTTVCGCRFFERRIGYPTPPSAFKHQL